MKTKIFYCFNGYCDTLIGQTSLSVPENPWKCTKCTFFPNKRRTNMCQKCGALCDLAQKQLNIKNKTIRVPRDAKEMIFEEDNWVYSLKFKLTSELARIDDKETFSDKYPIVIELTNNYVSLSVINNGATYFKLTGHLKKLPKKRSNVSENERIFDFAKNSIWVHKNVDYAVSSWNIEFIGEIIKPTYEFVDGRSVHERIIQKKETEFKKKSKFRNKETLIYHNSVYICYDIETANRHNDNQILSDIVPFMVAFLISYDNNKIKKVFTNSLPFGCDGGAHKDDVRLRKTNDEKQDYLDHLFEKQLIARKKQKGALMRGCTNKSCPIESRQFWEGFVWLSQIIIELARTKQKYHFTLFGFNNFKFDDEISLDYFLFAIRDAINNLNQIYYQDKGFYTVKIDNSKRFANVTSRIISIIPNKARINKYGSTGPHFSLINNLFTETIIITIKDVVNFVPNVSLAKACKDYEIVDAKMEIDSIKISNIISNLNYVPQTINLRVDNNHQIVKNSSSVIGTAVLLKNYWLSPTDKFNINFIKLTEDYCMRDVEATYELFMKITNNLIQVVDNYIEDDDSKFHPLGAISLAHFSKIIFDKIIDIKYNLFTDSQTRLIDETMFAGRVDYNILGNYESKGNLQYWDVTSEYPCAMTALYPIGNCRIITNYDKIELQSHIDFIYDKRQFQLNHELSENNDLSYFNKLDKIFFCRCDCFPPEDKFLIAWSPLATRLDMNGFLLRPGTRISRLGYFNTEFKNRAVNSIQIKTLLFGGWTVKITDISTSVIWDDCGQIFLPFIERLGKDKTEARETNKSYAKLLKLLMNAIPGKFGQKTFHKIHKSTRAWDCIFNQSEIETENLGYMSSFDNHLWLQNDSAKEEKASESAHYYASLIWAYANWILWGTAFKLNITAINSNIPLSARDGVLLYCDTDSIVFDQSKATVLNFLEDEEIGRWDVKMHCFRETWKNKMKNFDKIYIFGKKSYLCFEKNEPLIKHFKGIPDKGLEFLSTKVLDEGIEKFINEGQWSFKFDFEQLVRLPREIGSESINNTVAQGVMKKTLRFPLPELYYSVRKEKTYIVCTSFPTPPREIIIEHESRKRKRSPSPGENSRNRGVRAHVPIWNDEHWQDIHLQETDV